MNALADIGKVQANPKLAGALTAKIFDNLNESGIIDNEYITEVNNRLKGTQQPTQEQQTQPQQQPQGTNNLLDYLNQQ
jgi:hypothetical protein